MAKTKEDDLAEVIAKNLNTKFKDGQVAYLGHEDTPTDLKHFLSTGSSILDIAISNRSHGGIAYGRITELNGLEGSGKSLIAGHMMKNVQDEGGVAVLIDTETAVNWEFFEAVGLKRDKNFVYAHLDTVEDIFEAVMHIIETVRKSNKDRPVIIVIDSIAGASTKQEMENNFDRAGYATGKALILSMAMRKITSTIGREKIALVVTNQLRYKMDAMPFGDKYTTSGGKGLPYHASVRVRLTQTGKIKKKVGGKDEFVGVTVKATVIKNRLGPPLRTAEFDIYFDRGIDDYASWVKFLRKSNVIGGAKSNALHYKDDAGVEHKFGEANFSKYMEENPELRKELYLKLSENIVMLYSSEGLTSDDIDVQEETES